MGRECDGNDDAAGVYIPLYGEYVDVWWAGVDGSAGGKNCPVDALCRGGVACQVSYGFCCSENPLYELA